MTKKSTCYGIFFQCSGIYGCSKQVVSWNECQMLIDGLPTLVTSVSIQGNCVPCDTLEVEATLEVWRGIQGSIWESFRGHAKNASP